MNKILSNLMTFKNNPHASVAIYGAAAVEVLKIWWPSHASQLADSQKVLTWYGILAATTSGTPPPATDNPNKPNSSNMKTLLTILLLSALAGLMFTTGCASNPAVVGRVVSVTDRGFGLQVQTSTTSANSLPTVKLGFFSSNVVIEPVLTNAVASVPAIANTFDLDNKASGPISLAVQETFASGTYQTANPGTNTAGVTSQPIVAK